MPKDHHTPSSPLHVLAERLREDFEKQARWPAGTPGNKGGQFAPGKGGATMSGGGGAPGVGGSGGKKWWQIGNKQGAGTDVSPSSNPYKPGSGYSTGLADLFGGEYGTKAPPKPMAPPPGAKTHPKTDDDGKPVIVNYPTKASGKETWTDPKAVAVFRPGGEAPEALNGIPMKPWTSAPKTKAEWARVPGQNPDLDLENPFEAHPTKYTAAGVIIKEPDGRVWITEPTNHFGGYKNTFPKGTAEPELNLQANAIKETFEELGLQVRITGLIGDYEKTTSYARFYLAERVGGTPKDMGWESQAAVLAPPSQLRKLLNVKADHAIIDDLEIEGFFKHARDLEGYTGVPRLRRFIKWAGEAGNAGSVDATGQDTETKPVEKRIPASINVAERDMQDQSSPSSGGKGLHTEPGQPAGSEPQGRGEAEQLRKQSGVGNLRGEHVSRLGDGAASEVAKAGRGAWMREADRGSGEGDQERHRASDRGGAVLRDEPFASVENSKPSGVGASGLTRISGFDAVRAFQKAAKPQQGKKVHHSQLQKRWPAGTPLGGQFMQMDGDGLVLPPKIAGGLEGKNPGHYKKAQAAYALAANGKTKELMDLAISLTAKKQADAAAGKVSSHTKWHAQVTQYAAYLGSQMVEKPKAEAAAAKVMDKTTGPKKLSDLQYLAGKPGGSNPGGLYLDGRTGATILVKGNKQKADGKQPGHISDDRARNEVLAAKLMLAAGVGAPKMDIIDLEGKYGGGLGVTSQMINGASSFKPGSASHVEAAQKDFAVHAWLGNYDVMGMGYDNTMIKDGIAVNIDPGGALLFRAQGSQKLEFADDAPEFESMRNTSSEQKAVYGSMTKSMLQESAKKLLLIDDQTIRDMVKAHGPKDIISPDKLADTLIARKNAILAKAGVDATTTPSEPAVTVPPPAPPKLATAKGVAAAGGMPKPPSFKQGLADDWYKAKAKALYDAALAGDLAKMEHETNVVTWSKTSANGKKLTAYIAALTAKVQGEVDAAIKEVAVGAKTITDDNGAEWTGKDSVITPVGGVQVSKTMQTAIMNVAAKESGPLSGVDLKKLPLLQAAAASGDAATLASIKMSHKGGKKLQSMLYAQVTGGAPLPPPGAGGTVKPTGQKAAPAKPKSTAADAQGKIPKNGFGALNTDQLTLIKEAVTRQFGPFSNDLKNDIEFYAMDGNKIGVLGATVKGFNGQEKKAGQAYLNAVYEAMTGMPMASQYGFSVAAALFPKPKADDGLIDVADLVDQEFEPLGTTTAQPQPKPKATVPDSTFTSAKLPTSNTNAPSHNAKIDAIKAAFDKGEEKALLALNFGSNNYAAKQVKLTNDLLAALGSVHQVSMKQKANSHPALIGGTGQPGTENIVGAIKPNAAPKKPRGNIPPEKLPPAPDVMNWNGPGNAYSTKAWKNQANIDAIKSINVAAMTGGFEAVKALKFPVLNPDTGEPTGEMKSIMDHPAKKLVSAYIADIQNAIEDWKNPPKPLASFNILSATSVADISKKFIGAKPGTVVATQAKEHQFGFWLALGKADTAVEAIKPKTVQDLSTSKVQAGKAAYQSYSTMTKHFVSGIQSSSALNYAYREGKKSFNGHDLTEMAKAVYKDATPMAEGDTLYRWQNMPSGMLKQIEQATPGLVFQATGPMCTSYHPTATSGFGTHRMVIRAAKGAKAIHSHGSGGYSGEKEVSTLPGQRFVFLGKTKVGNRWDIEVMMLPPEEYWTI